MAQCLPPVTHALCLYSGDYLVPLSLCNLHVPHFYTICQDLLTFLGYGYPDSQSQSPSLSVYTLRWLPVSHDAVLPPSRADHWAFAMLMSLSIAHCQGFPALFSSHAWSGPHILASLLDLPSC